MTHFCRYSNSGAKRRLEDLLVLGLFTGWLGTSLYRSFWHDGCHLGLFWKKNLSTSSNSVARSAKWSLRSCDAHFRGLQHSSPCRGNLLSHPGKSHTCCSWLIIWIFYLVSAKWQRLHTLWNILSRFRRVCRRVDKRYSTQTLKLLDHPKRICQLHFTKAIFWHFFARVLSKLKLEKELKVLP